MGKRLCCVQKGKEWAGWRGHRMVFLWGWSFWHVPIQMKKLAGDRRCVLKMLTERFVL